jgi:Xaa-Pro aminopeptidase
LNLSPSTVQYLTCLEPGYYEDNNFGIRIENIIMAKEVSTPYKFGDKPWLGFEHVTMTPLCKKLLDVELLTPDERKWIDEYHKEIWEKTSKYFESDERTKKWLARETEPLGP